MVPTGLVKVELSPVAVLHGLPGGIKPLRVVLHFGWAFVTACIICRWHVMLALPPAVSLHCHWQASVVRFDDNS